MASSFHARRLRAALFFSLVLAAAGTGVAVEFRGGLDPVPGLGTRVMMPLKPAENALRALLPAPVAAGERVWETSRPFAIKGMDFPLAVVESPAGDLTLWIDRDRNGIFDAKEQWPLAGAEPEAALTLPWDNGIYREFPIHLRAAFNDQPGNGATRREPGLIFYNFNLIFGAAVEVDGQTLHLSFGPRPAETAVNLATARITADTNFDGRIDPDLGEAENPSGKSPVFRVGARYLAVKSVDMATGEVVLEERPATDYTRFDARPGQEMPDFTFTTLDGASQKLSGLRGKYVLLDFWGTWCGPCIGEMQLLDPVYAKYHPRGFEVIGMNMEKTAGSLTPEAYAADESKVRAFIAKAGHQWLQATQRSIECVAIDVIHVSAYPTCILIGPEGRVIAREARGKVLEKLLEEHLPTAR